MFEAHFWKKKKRMFSLDEKIRHSYKKKRVYKQTFFEIQFTKTNLQTHWATGGVRGHFACDA